MAKITEDIINEIIKEYGGEGIIKYDGEFKKERPYIWLKHIDGRREECRKTKEEISCKVRKLLNGVTLDAINRIIKENGGEGIVTYDGEYREGRFIYVWLKHIDGRRESCQKRTESIKYKTRSLIRNIEITIDTINEIIKENGAEELIEYDGEFKEEKTSYIWLKCIDGRREKCKKNRTGIESKVKKLVNEKIITIRDGIEGKVCSKCNEWKPLSHYRNSKERKDGLSLNCKECLKKYEEEYNEKNKEILKEKKKEYYEKNKEHFKITGKEYREKNKEKLAAAGKQYREANKEKIAEYQKEYAKNNKERLQRYRKEYQEANRDVLSAKSKEYRNKEKERLAEMNRKYRAENRELLLTKSQKYYQENKEEITRKNKERYERDREKIRERRKELYQKNKEKIRIQGKESRKRNIEKIKMRAKIYRMKNKQRIADWKKEYYINNKEKVQEYKRGYYLNIKKENINNIINTLEELNPIFEQLNLPVYGYIYKITHNNGHCYIGQSVQPLNRRYYKDVIKKWIEERKNKANQKFLEELTEEEFSVEIIDVAISRWHLDKMEAYYIDKYNSYEDGYNNTPGNYKTNDGLEEFENILKEYNIKFEENKLIEM